MEMRDEGEIAGKSERRRWKEGESARGRRVGFGRKSEGLEGRERERERITGLKSRTQREMAREREKACEKERAFGVERSHQIEKINTLKSTLYIPAGCCA